MSQPPIPPRPSRSKSPHPAIPPRPVRISTPREPTPNLIPESTELHAPRAARPIPVPKTSSDFAITPASITPASTTPGYRDEPAKSPKSSREGIPHIGRRVPMDPDAGDVQAPTPNATPSGGRKKHVYREEWEMEEGAYGQPGRGKTPYSMSSTDLNAVVAHAESVGVGASPRDDGVPDEELGYLASDHYAKNMSRAQSPSHGESKKVSPAGSNDGREDPATIEEGESDEVIHIDEPTHGAGILRHGTADVHSRAQSVHEDEEAAEREEASILALDEVLKRQKGQYMQAAITPRGTRSRPRSALEESEEQAGGEGLKVKTERPGAVRTPYEELSPVDEKAKPLFEEEEGEDREEEEPLPKELHEKIRPRLNDARFPSNDTWEEAPSSSQLSATVGSPVLSPTAAAGDEEEHDPESKAHQRRNSNEPEPEYVQGQPGDHYQPGDEFEQVQREKQDQRAAQDYSVDLKHLPEDERLQRLLNHSDKPSSETPSHRSRNNARKFPSNDTWEDVPPSLDLEATIDPEPVAHDRATTTSITSISAAAPRPTTGAPLEVPPTTTRKPEVPMPPARPAVPARPKRTVDIKLPSPENSASPTSPTKPPPPSIPGRPKPTIPARPARPAKPAVLARLPSSDEPPAPKPKPIVPPRTGGKIAALKAGLGDLESRLRLGPSAPKKQDEPEEKKEMEKAVEVKEPLVDARKTRTRGPRGRKLPTAAEKKPEVKPAPAKQVEKLEIAGVWTVWTVDEDLDAVIVGSAAVIDDEPVVVEKPAEEPTLTDMPTGKLTKEKPAEEKPAEEKPAEEKPSTPEPAGYSPSTPTHSPPSAPARDFSPAAETQSSVPELKRAKDAVMHASPTFLPESAGETEALLPTTTTLPGVTRTGDHVVVATQQGVKTPEVPEHIVVPLNPTAIPDSQHPEDALAVKGEGVEVVQPEKPMAVEEGRGFGKVEREDVKGDVGEIKQGKEAEEEQREVVEALDGAELGERLEREG